VSDQHRVPGPSTRPIANPLADVVRALDAADAATIGAAPA
jgi:hypothetical protein